MSGGVHSTSTAGLTELRTTIEVTWRQALAEVKQLGEATRYLRQAVNIDPLDVEKRLALAQALVMQKRFNEATEQLRKDIGFMLSQGRSQEAAKLQKFLESAEPKKSEQKQ